MDNNKHFDRLFESAKDSAQRQDEVFNRIQDIVKENPETAKQYLQHLTKTSKWELYSRIYGKFAYISLLIAFLIVGLVVGLKKMNGISKENSLESFINLKPSFKLTQNNSDKYYVSYIDLDTTTILGRLENFVPSSELKTQKIKSGWNIFKDKFNMGSVSFNAQQFSMDFDDEQYNIKTPHVFGSNSQFWFSVDSVNNVIKKDTITSIVYLVRFGEKNQSNEIIWQESPFRIKKSPDARGLLEKGRSNLIKITHPDWQNTYFVELAIGNNCMGDIYKLYGNGFAIRLK